MSILERLAALGLTTESSPEGPLAELSLGDGPLLHPVSGEQLVQVTFAVEGEVLAPVAPPALIGLGTFPVEGLASSGELADRVRERFGAQLAILGRRAAELDALGLVGEVDPASLSLKSHVTAPPWSFTVVSDREGNFRLAEARREQVPVRLERESAFDLSAFSDRAALAHYLTALMDEAGTQPRPLPRVHYGELARAFGPAALVPPQSPLELLVELEVDGRRYRFAAARVMGRTFRGLLAGRRGKLWAERFELEDFPGVAALAARILGVPPGMVKVLGGTGEGLGQ